MLTKLIEPRCTEESSPCQVGQQICIRIFGTCQPRASFVVAVKAVVCAESGLRMVRHGETSFLFVGLALAMLLGA